MVRWARLAGCAVAAVATSGVITVNLWAGVRKMHRFATAGDVAAYQAEHPGALVVACHGVVYDVASAARFHPGGRAPLAAAAGTDITAAFDARHGKYHLGGAAALGLQFHWQIGTMSKPGYGSMKDTWKPSAAA
jgi:predicted heme/steroid binding protein